jgi:hypothetical protein
MSSTTKGGVRGRWNLQPTEDVAKRTTGLGGTQPSCFALISSSGPVSRADPKDQSGDMHLYDNNQ